MRVCASSPPTRMSLAIGKSPGVLAGFTGTWLGAAAHRWATTSVGNKPAKLAARTDMGTPSGSLLLHYGHVVNWNLSARACALIRWFARCGNGRRAELPLPEHAGGLNKGG